MKRFVSLAVPVLGLVLASNAIAVPIELKFSGNAFDIVNRSSAYPNNPVSGSMVFEAADANSPIVSLTSINLTIAGHVYSLAEAQVQSHVGLYLQNEVGGARNGINTVFSGTDDFDLWWDYAPSNTPNVFIFATPAVPSANWAIQVPTPGFTSFSVVALPEPGSLGVLCIGASAVLTRRRRNRAARRNAKGDTQILQFFRSM